VKLPDARIGYAGYSRDFSAPGDRRRFVAYAKARNLAFEYADLAREYGLVLVTHNGDIPGWTELKRQNPNLKFVFELADSYFTRTGLPGRYLKGAARYALGTDSRLSPDFFRTLIAACEVADARRVLRPAERLPDAVTLLLQGRFGGVGGGMSQQQARQRVHDAAFPR